MEDIKNGDDIVVSDFVGNIYDLSREGVSIIYGIYSLNDKVEEIFIGENLEEERNDGVRFGIESGNCDKDKD